MFSQYRKCEHNLEELRKCPEEAENYFLRIKVPDIALSYENSMVLDLYDNRFVLGEVLEDGSFKSVGIYAEELFTEFFAEIRCHLSQTYVV